MQTMDCILYRELDVLPGGKVVGEIERLAEMLPNLQDQRLQENHLKQSKTKLLKLQLKHLNRNLPQHKL